MKIKENLVSCKSAKDFTDFCKRLTPTFGTFGGRRFSISDKSDTLCLNDLIKHLDLLQVKYSQEPALYLEDLDQRAEGLLKREKSLLFRIVTYIKRFFSNLVYNRQTVIKKLKAVAERRINILQERIQTAFKRAQEVYKETAFSTYFGEQKLRDNLKKLVDMKDKEGLEAALVYRKIKRGLTKLLKKIERLEVGPDAEKQRNESLEKRAARIQKAIADDPINSNNSHLPALYKAFEDCRSVKLEDLIASGKEWTSFSINIGWTAYQITLYSDGKSFIHLPINLGEGSIKMVDIAINYESNSLVVDLYPLIVTSMKVEKRLKNETAIIDHLNKGSNTVGIKKKRFGPSGVRWFAPYYNCGNLYDFSRSTTFDELDNQSLKNLYLDMARGISQVHEKEIIHRDVKEDNILIERLPALSGNKMLYRAALTDFDFARKNSEAPIDRFGTPFYFAPEILRYKWTEDYSRDWYGFGMVIAFTCKLDLPEFSCNLDEYSRLHHTKTLKVENDEENIPPSLVKNLTCLDPAQRNPYHTTVEQINAIDWCDTQWKWNAKLVHV